MAPHIYMSEHEQRQILQQRTLKGHHCRMSFYDVYLDLMEKTKQDAKYWSATVHGKDMRLVKVSCGFFREEIPLFERFRHRMLWISEWSVFENFVVILIVCNALVMAHPVAYDEMSQPLGVQNTYFVFETLVSGVFVIELLCRVIAYGFFFGDAPNPCFLKEPANWIDLMVVIFTFSEPFAAEVISEQDLRTMRVLRIFRVFRLVKKITFLPRLRNIVHSLSISLYRLWVSWLAIIFTLLVISLAGMDLWGDAYWRRCRLTEEPYSLNGTLVWPVDPEQLRFCGGRYVCGKTAAGAETFCKSPVSSDSGPIPGYDPWPELFANPFADYGFTGYQTLWSGLLTTFQVVNIDGWVNLMNRFEDAKWPGLSIPFFVVLMLFGGLVLMNLVLAILWYSFDMTVQEDRSHQGDYKLLMEAKRMDPPPVITEDIQVLPLHALVSSVQDLEVQVAAAQAFHALDTEFRSMGIKNICYSMITNPWFGRVMNIIIIINALCMCFDIYPPYDDTMLLILDNINTLCSLIFFAEVCIKIIGVGVSFFEDSGNRFDFLLVMLSVVELFMSGGSALSALRTARLLRIFRMIHMSMNLRILLMVFQMAVTPTLYFSMIVILFLYCSCLAGLQIFYKHDIENPKNGLGFDSLGMGFLTSLAVFSGDGWLEITTQQIQGQDNQLFGFFYFLLSFLLGKAVLKNLLLGIIAAEFRIARDRMKQDFRLRMAIARASLQKLRKSESSSNAQGGDHNGEAQENPEDVPESPRWPQQAFSRLEGSTMKTCARNMDVIKMIHVKGQAAKRLQELGKIHAMGKSKYAWPMGERHPPDAGISDVEAMLQSSVAMQQDGMHRAAPPEAPQSRPGLRVRVEARHGAACLLEEENSSAWEDQPGHITIRVAPVGDGWSEQEEPERVEPIERQFLPKAPSPRATRWRGNPTLLHRAGAPPLECLPVWYGKENPGFSGQVESAAKVSFVERYRAARAGFREGDGEAPQRPAGRCHVEAQHRTAALEPRGVTLDEEPQIIGEEVPLAALEDLQVEIPKVETQEERHSAVLVPPGEKTASPEKKSMLELLRGCARSIMDSHGFEPVVLFVIVISSVSLAFETPYADPNSEVTFLQAVIDKFSVGVITLEMMVRMLVMGLWKRPSECKPGELPGYFRVPWHVLDFVICLGGLTYVLAEFFTTNLNDLKSIRVLKMVSMLRPLRLIGKTSSVRLIIEALLAAIPTLINMSLMSAMFFLGFALLFVGFFKGALYRCTLDPLGDLRPDIVTMKDCLKAGGQWINSQSHFDRVTDSLVTLMHIGSGEGWIDVTLNIISAQGIDLQPRPKSRVEQAVPVVIFMALTNFFLLNLLTGILVDSYTSTKAEFKGQSADTSEERLLKKLQREILMNPELLIPPRRIGVTGNCFTKTRQRLKVFIEHRISRSVIFVGILSNALVLCISPIVNPELVSFRTTVSGLLLGLFTIELAIKIFVYSTDFFKDRWHAYDSFAISGSLIGVLVNALVTEKGVMTQILGGFQILRVLMLVRYAWFMDSITSTIWVALPGLLQVCALLTLLMFMYACLGVGLFGTVMSSEGQTDPHGPYPENDINFHSFGNAFMLLIRCATGERWHDIMYDIAADKPGCSVEPQSYQELVRDGPRGCGTILAYPYFISYIAIILFNMMNLIVAVVLDAYGQVHELIELEDFMVCVGALREAWVEVDRNFLGYLHLQEVERILLTIPQPVGFLGAKRKSMFRQMMDLEVHEGSTLSYRDVVKLVAQRSVAFLSTRSKVNAKQVKLDEDALRTWNGAFPELPAEYAHDAVLIAHIVIARRVAIYIRKKRWEWKQKSRHGQGALRNLRRAAASSGGEKAARSGSPRSASPRSGSPMGEGKTEADLEDALYDVGVDLDTTIPLWERSLDPGPPTSILVSQLAPEDTTHAHREKKLPPLSPLPWPPRELERFQPEEEMTFTVEESVIWAKVAGLAQSAEKSQLKS